VEDVISMLWSAFCRWVLTFLCAGGSNVEGKILWELAGNLLYGHLAVGIHRYVLSSNGEEAEEVSEFDGATEVSDVV
jgi:hypothetical protein